MRIFIALDIDNAIRDCIQRFTDDMRKMAPDARWVKAESLHVTLKFVGEKPGQAVDEIREKLHSVHSSLIHLRFRGTGFFPTPTSARVFWVGVESGPELAALAEQVDTVTSQLGIPREERGFSPHLTLARAGGKSGTPRRQKGDHANAVFTKVREKLAGESAPEFGTMAAREFYLYESKLSPHGAQYSKIERYALDE